MPETFRTLVSRQSLDAVSYTHLSYSKTSSEEPDRRQVMFRQMSDGTWDLFKLNAQETMRYFGKLDEDEWVGDVQAQYRFSDENKLRFGAALRDKMCIRDSILTLWSQNKDTLLLT